MWPRSMKIAPTTERGHIYCWVHSTSHWGEEGNDRIFPLAEGFSRFLQGLYDDEHKSDGKRWSRYETLARELEL